MTGDRQKGILGLRGLLSQWQAVGLTFIALSMPLLLPGFGWLYAFVPLPAFYFLVVEGEEKGLQIISWAALLTGAGALIVHGLGFFLFTASFLAVSFSLTRSLRLHQDPATAGMRACAALFAAWCLFAAGYGVMHKNNLYADLLSSIDRGVKEAYPVYMKSTELSDSLKQQISTTFDTVRQTMPKILPALLVLWLITTVWLTMSLGAHLIRKRRPERMVWPPYRDWRLPEPHRLAGNCRRGACFLFQPAMPDSSVSMASWSAPCFIFSRDSPFSAPCSTAGRYRPRSGS